MVQELTTLPSAWSNFGKGLGQGFANASENEIAYQRKRAGLQGFSNEVARGNLTPLQIQARAGQIPGITPQEIESFQKLAHTDAQRAPRRQQIPGQLPPQASPQQQGLPRQDVAFLNNLPQRTQTTLPNQGGANAPQGMTTAQKQVAAQEATPPKRTLQNELSTKFRTPNPLDVNQREEAIDHLLYTNPNMTRPEAENTVDGWYKQEVDKAKTEKENRETEKAARTEVDDEVKRQLNQYFEIGEGKDRKIEDFISGKTQEFIKNKAYDELETNPNTNAREAAKKWIEKADHFKRIKGQLDSKSQRSMFDSVYPSRKEATLESIKSAQEVYKEFDALPELYEKLQTNPINNGFGLSAGNAALLTYPRSEPVKNMLKEYDRKSWNNIPFDKVPARSKQLAKDVIQKIGKDDSILAIAKQMSQEFPYFDSDAFFSYLKKHSNEIEPKHQKEEVIKGRDDLFPNWGDMFLFPAIGRSKAHDKIR